MTPTEKDAATIRRQQQRIEYLEEVLLQMQAQRKTDQELPVILDWGLTRSQNTLLMAFFNARDGFLSHQQVWKSIPRRDQTTKDFSDLVKVNISLFRKKVKPFGIEVLTLWAQWYRLMPASREIIKAAIEQRTAA